MELGKRAFDVLVVLIEADGAVVSRDELMSRVWPGRIVENNDLTAMPAGVFLPSHFDCTAAPDGRIHAKQPVSMY